MELDVMSVTIRQRLVAIGTTTAAVITLLAGCSHEAANVTSLTWMDDGWVYGVDRRVDATNKLVRFREGEGPSVVDFGMENCDSPDLSAVTRVAPNILAAATSCVNGSGTDLVQVDLSTMKAEVLGRLHHVSVQDMAWTPDLGVGYVAVYLGSCYGIARVEGGVVVPFGEPLTIDGAVWAIDEIYTNADQYLRGLSCDQLGEVRAPYLVGSTLYFGVSGFASGLAGTYARKSALTSIVRLGPEDSVPLVVSRGFQLLEDLALTPDGGILAVAGQRDGVDSCWLVDLASGHVTDLEISNVDSLSISPAGDRVVAEAGGRAVFRDIP